MKDAVLTIRLTSATRKRVEDFARRESRSISQAAERLLQMGLSAASSGEGRAGETPAAWGAPAPLAGLFQGELVPTLEDFREVRSELSAAMNRRSRPHGQSRRRR